MRQPVARVAVATMVIAMTGCGAELVDVHGQVTYNGAPLGKPNGQIVFIGTNGKQVVAEIGQDGTYRATRVQTGLNRIAVYYLNPETQRVKRFPKKGETPPLAPSTTPSPFLTPMKYASVETSNLSIQVEKDTAFNTDLTGPVIP
jgi:hypothetical protein